MNSSSIINEGMIFLELADSIDTGPRPVEQQPAQIPTATDHIVFKVAQEMGMSANVIRRIIERVDFFMEQHEERLREKNSPGTDGPSPST